MAIVGALVVGIGAYRAGGSNFPQLRFAAEDARAIAGYLRECWSSDRGLKIVLIDENDATETAIKDGFLSLAHQGPFDLCWVFLSGHGWVDETSAGFLVQPDGPGHDLPLLAASTLNQLLGGIAADRTILVLDCCFAEGLVRRMPFFTALGSSVARLYVASSREQQRTWEDDGIKHGVFTAHLLDLLNTGNSAQLGTRRTQLDVDAELFPMLCEQVPLYVLEHKNGAHQEPVKGGVSSSAVTLPVASAARRVRDRTALGTAIRRLRQIMTGLAVGAVALLLLTYTLVYYIEPGANGTLIVRHGTRWLQPLLQVLPLTRVDTGIAVAELSSNGAAASPVQSGYASGIWTHEEPAGGYRTWFTDVLAGLDPVAAARYSTLAGDPPQALSTSPRPLEVERAAWMALSDGRPEKLGAILQYIPGGDRRSRILEPFPTNKMDFEVLDLTEANMVSYANALAYSAALDPLQTFPAYLGFAKATQEWLTHNTDEQRGRGARARVRSAVAEVLEVISTARTDRGLTFLDASDRVLLQSLAVIGYGDVIGQGLSRLPEDGRARIAVATDALKRFSGNPDEPSQGAAFEIILASLDDSAAAKSLVDAVVSKFVQSGGTPNSYYTRFLIAAADQRALSAGLVNQLVGAARVALSKAETDFEDSEQARVLAHAMSQISPADRPVAFELINRAANSVTPISTATAEMYATLGRQELDPPGMLAKVEEQAHKAKPYTPDDPDTALGPVPGMVIVVGTGPWLVALAEYGRTRELPAQDVALLRDHVANPSLRDLLVPALVRQEGANSADVVVGSWISRLAALKLDARARGVEQAIIAGALAARPRTEFVSLIERLRIARADNREPELRIALGAIIIDAQIARARGCREVLSYARECTLPAF